MEKLEKAAKKYLSQQNKDFFYWLKWRLTFIWKDPEYLESWKEIKGLRQKAGFPINFIELLTNEDYSKTSEFEKECRITENFNYEGIFINPQETFDELINGKTKMYLRAYLSGVFKSNAIIFNPSVAEHDPNGLIIKIDFRFIRNITDAINLIKDKVRLEYQYYSNSLSLNKTDFDKIYQIGLLREAGQSWGEIARKVFPGEPGDSAKTKVQQHHARYIELINGGWRNLRFP
ncbi:MAG: hypothetical protein ACOZFS_05975 [Thermodesulfobacteriota bacterium]